jgi:flavin-dependent dehydrogenase
MDDVLIVGAGPAGAVAAVVLARAGARVRLVDRSKFPRHKLCGDTLNPGTLAVLGRLGLRPLLEPDALRLEGMIVSGPRGVAVEGRYGRGLHGLSLSRSLMDQMLVGEAVRAGAQFEPGIAVRDALIDDKRGVPTVAGVTAVARGVLCRWRAPVVIAADGRRSTLASTLGLLMQTVSPRRWAVGAYFEDAARSTLGEMHVRKGRYIGVAPLPGGVSNVCVVKPAGASDSDWSDPEALLRRELDQEPMLRDRFAGARVVRPPMVLGPLASDITGGMIDGLLLAGDAAGFIDPMTGDGLRFAVRGGELAAAAALEALAQGWNGLHARLAAERRREFSAKWRFNRALRAGVERPAIVEAAAAGAQLLPGLVRRMITYAGDCGVARSQSRSHQPSAVGHHHIHAK